MIWCCLRCLSGLMGWFVLLREFPHFQRRIAVNNAIFECGIKDGSEIISRIVLFETLRRIAVGVSSTSLASES
jgi:hypothetical protein